MVEINRVWINVDTDTNKIILFGRPRVSIRVDEYIWSLIEEHIVKPHNPIQDGETVDGVENGQMSREIQWKCQYEDAMIQPPRGVLDINMGDYASGKR